MISRREWLKRALLLTAGCSLPPIFLMDGAKVPGQEGLSSKEPSPSFVEQRTAPAARPAQLSTPGPPPTVAEIQKEQEVKAAFPRVAATAIAIRRSGDRGRANHGWLDARHTFSFSNYYDPKHTHFRSLLVLNEDRIAPGRGFRMHPHKDMEIITYILEGALEHKDNLHNGSIIRPGEVQKMSAGSGIWHSEFNPQQTKPVHLMQIWIRPDRRNLKPGYQQRIIKPQTVAQPIRLIASPNGEDGAVKMHQDAYLYACRLRTGQSIAHISRIKRHTWIQVARGQVEMNGLTLHAGDGASTSQSGTLHLKATKGSEMLIFDLA